MDIIFKLLNKGHVNGEYDPKIGFIVSFLDDEESGFFECRLVDDHEIYNEFQVIINGQGKQSRNTEKNHQFNNFYLLLFVI